jgi:hypothetical protein
MTQASNIIRKVIFAGMLLVVLLLVFSPAEAETMRVVALSHSGDSPKLLTALAGLGLAEDPGDATLVFDAHSRSKITDISIPNDPTKARAERKIEYIAPALKAVKDFFATAPAPGVDGSAIEASSFLDSIAPLIVEHPEGMRVLLVGNPWFTAPGALDGKSYEGSFPSDGMILGDRSHSPFGTQGRRDLSGVSVYYCSTTGAAAFLTPEHLGRVERAWSLLIKERGGQLTLFSTDLTSCLERFRDAKAPDAKVFNIDQTDAQVFAMYKAKDITPPIVDAPPVKTAQPALPPTNTRAEEAARFAQAGRMMPPSTLTGPAWLGIQWHGPDLDLYVRCSPNAPFLFFGNQRTFEGIHEYDVRGDAGNTFEAVDLTQPCADISKATVWINFYDGRVSAPINGVVAVKFDGNIYKSDFTMPALYGNGGRGLTASGDMSGSPFWVKIDVPGLLHLTGAPQRHTPR